MANILDVHCDGGWNLDRRNSEGADEMIQVIEAVAQYIFDSDCERDSYQEYIEDGNDPRDHVYYRAAMILGHEDDFADDVENYKLSKI